MKLYVGNLGDDGNITSGDLRPLFEQYGTVTECECIKNYAFVHMDEESAATEAVNNLNGHSVKGRPIKVEKSESKGPRKPSQKLFIGNIAEGTTNEELKSCFERFAGVLEADVIKNFGFVHIDANAGRQKVNEIIRELNGYNLNGNSIRVQMSTSGVRQRPGMGGDQCYRCGREGHWSKECPQYPDYPPNYGGGGGRGGRGGPMRGQPPYGRGPAGGYNRDPYPPPPPPSYMRDRMDGYGYGGYGRDPYARGGDPYARGGDPMYDRRQPYPPPGGRAMGGSGPMRGPDPYAGRDPYANGSYAQDYSQPAFSTGAGAGAAYSTGYGAPGASGGAGADMYSRRSPGPGGPMPPRGAAPQNGSYGPPPQRAGPPGGYPASGAPPAAPAGGPVGGNGYSGGYGAMY